MALQFLHDIDSRLAIGVRIGNALFKVRFEVFRDHRMAL
jgi:hypothetical protein